MAGTALRTTDITTTDVKWPIMKEEEVPGNLIPAGAIEIHRLPMHEQETPHIPAALGK